MDRKKTKNRGEDADTPPMREERSVNTGHAKCSSLSFVVRSSV